LNILLMARSVWVALFAGFLAALLLVLMNRSQFMMYRQLLNRIIRLVWMGLGAALIAAVLYGSLFSFDAFRERFREMTQRQYGTNAFAYDPLGGFDGPGTFPSHCRHRSGNWKVWIPSTGIHDELEARSNTRIQRPHNDFLWIWTENGSIGLLLFLLFVVLLFRQGLESLRHAAHPHDKW
jgi:O-antigen ligase